MNSLNDSSAVQPLIDESIDRECTTVIALSHCLEYSTVLADLVYDTAPRLFHYVMQQFVDDSSSLKGRLALVLVAYVIQFYLFGPVSATLEDPYLPESLSRASQSLLSEAVRSYADYTRQTNLLAALAAPSLRMDVPLSPDRGAKWREYWFCNRPPNSPTVYLLETRKDVSMMSDDTIEIQRPGWVTAIFGCFGGVRRDHRSSL